MTLFDAGDPAPRNPAPREHLSAGRRLTMRQRFDVARGIHPLTRERVNPDGEKRCGNCRFRDPGRYPKCLWRPEGATSGFPFVTSGPATDVRAWWPACKRWAASAAGKVAS